MTNAEAAHQLIEWLQRQGYLVTTGTTWDSIKDGSKLTAQLDKLFPVSKDLEAVVRGALSTLMKEYITKYNWSGYWSTEKETKIQNEMKGVIVSAVARLLDKRYEHMSFAHDEALAECERWKKKLVNKDKQIKDLKC